MKSFVRPRDVVDPPVRVVVFHHAGGSAAAYYPLTRVLPHSWDLLLVDLPGRGKRHAETPVADLDEVVTSVLEDLTPMTDVRLALFGHSYGAVVASEVARGLVSTGAEVVWVGVSGRGAPAHPSRTRRLQTLDERELLDELLALGGTPDRIREFPDFQRRFLQIARADLSAVDSFDPARPRVKLRCPLAAYAGHNDSWAAPEAMGDWAHETHHHFSQRVFAGGHFYFLGDGLAGLGRAICADLAPHVAIEKNRSATPISSSQTVVPFRTSQGDTIRAESAREGGGP